MRRFLIYFLISASIFSVTNAQKKKLTFDQVFKFQPPRLSQATPRLSGWIDSENYLEVKPPSEGQRPTLMKTNAATGESEVYIDYAQWNAILPEGFTVERAQAVNNYSGFLFDKDNDLYYLSIKNESFARLTEDEIEEMNPKVSADGRYVAYTKNKDLYVYDIEMEEEKRLTNDASETVYNGWSSWVYMEEILGRSTGYAAFWWSPNSEMVAFMKFDDSPVHEFTLFNADGQHGSVEKERYPKPGDPNPKAWIGIANVKSGDIVWVDAMGDNDQFIAWPSWSDDSKTLYFEWLNRKMDNLKLYAVNPLDGKKKEVYNEKQKTWVDWVEDLYLFKDNSGFLMRSAVDGYYHLYYYGNDGKLVSRLTSGEWDVTSIELVDEGNDAVYFMARKGETTQQHLYKINFDGSSMEQLTESAGWHNCTVSPEGKYFYDRYSSITDPTKLDLLTGEGELIRNLGDAKSPIYDEYDLAKVELFTIPSGDGFDLPAKWYLPPDFDESKKYPVIFSVYGGPGMGTVRNSSSMWMVNYYLAQEGIIVIEVDHRGSGHFGKKGIDLMHRQLGKWELHDYGAAVKWLEEKPFINKDKIAITGGSYGGYVTCLALTKGSDYFDYGIAEYSVTDWTLYDNVYTERYMDTPEENPEGYKESSAIENADKYKGGMLIVHGSMDDNVHMQNTFQLIDKLENLDKDFELMIYPNERHGVRFPKFFHNQRNSLKFWYKNLLDKELE